MQAEPLRRILSTIDMKTKLYILLAAALSFAACSPDDATRDYGFAKVYIPQATVTGLDNTYPIPLGAFYQNSVYTCSYDKASGKLSIALGVIRSGYLAEQKAFSVSLAFSQSETDSKLDEYSGKGTPAQALPVDMCTIPSKIEVPAGSNGGTCTIDVDMKALALQKSSLWVTDSYKLLVLGLAISEPTEYELAEKNTSVVIVIDLNSSHWDTVGADKPESEIRTLFPIE